MMKAKQIFNINPTLITDPSGAYGVTPAFANHIGKSIWHRVTKVNTISRVFEAEFTNLDRAVVE